MLTDMEPSCSQQVIQWKHANPDWPDGRHLADPAEVSEPAQVCILHRAGRWALRCHEQARIVQLSRQPGLDLRVLPDEVPARASTKTGALGLEYHPKLTPPF